MGALFDLLRAFSRMPGALARRSDERRHRTQMRKATRYALADMPENTFGKVVGRVRPSNKRLLEAPASGRLCVYYEVAIDSMVDGALSRTLAFEQEGMSFVLEDETGRAVVDPAHAYMSTAIDHVGTSTLHDASPRQRTLLDRNEIVAVSKITFIEDLRYREAIIEADELIAVFGGGIRELDPDGDRAARQGGGDATAGDARHTPYRGGSVATRLCLTGTSRFPLFISDDPKAL